VKDKERERDTERSGLMDCSERSKMALQLETTERTTHTANNRKTVLANRKPNHSSTVSDYDHY